MPKEEIKRPEEKNENVYVIAPPSEKSPYTLREAALILRMSEKSVRRQIDRGNLRRCESFGRVLIPKKDVDDFMEKQSGFAC